MSVDYSKPIEIAENIYWVGSVIPNDPFQCHVYLIENEDESVLLDPGSMITFPETVDKITEITPLRNIKYIIAHHQDPDITGCVSTLEKLIPRKDKFIVTHWRAQALLKHYQWKTPFYLIDEHKWRLILKNNRILDFVFTPYAHFPGAFCTFDRKTKTLFSSDLFGGFTETFSLFAEDEQYFECIKAFHEHYIPSREILNNALIEIEKKDPELIAPQHGSIIKKDLIPFIINRLKELNCGLYLLTSYESNIETLVKVNYVMKKVFEEVLLNTDFISILRKTATLISENGIPVKDIVAYCIEKKDDEDCEYFGFSAKEGEIPKESLKNNSKILEALSHHLSKPAYHEKIRLIYEQTEFAEHVYGMPIDYKKGLRGCFYFVVGKKLKEKEEKTFIEVIEKLKSPLSSSLEKEIILKKLDQEKKELFNTSIHDGLTGLKNRVFLEHIAKTEVDKAIRYQYPLSVIMFDIDHFKSINDTYGHLAGDFILQELSKIIKNSLRGTDYVIRYGGEEILAILPYAKLKDACKRAEQIKKAIENHEFVIGNKRIKITVSAGVYQRQDERNIYELIHNADKLLYKAKYSGRNQVSCE